MLEELWHRKETRLQTEKTNVNLQHRENPVYLTKNPKLIAKRVKSRLDPLSVDKKV